MGRTAGVMSMRNGPPPNWPSSVKYLSYPIASPKLPSAAGLMYCYPAPPPPPTRLGPGPNTGTSFSPPALRLKQIAVDGHPAKGQFGLFNGPKKLAPGRWIRDYIGVVHGEEDKDESSDYDLSLDAVRGIGCDASKMGNESRFVNDYRGVLSRPNARFDLREFPLPVSNGRGPSSGTIMAIFAGPHGVEKHEEICVSYGKGFWENRAGEEAVKDAEEVPEVLDPEGERESLEKEIGALSLGDFNGVRARAIKAGLQERARKQEQRARDRKEKTRRRREAEAAELSSK